MLAHVRERLLDDEDHLELFARRELRAVPDRGEAHADVRLAFEAVNHGAHALEEPFIVKALAELRRSSRTSS